MCVHVREKERESETERERKKSADVQLFKSFLKKSNSLRSVHPMFYVHTVCTEQEILMTKAQFRNIQNATKPFFFPPLARGRKSHVNVSGYQQAQPATMRSVPQLNPPVLINQGTACQRLHFICETLADISERRQERMLEHSE